MDEPKEKVRALDEIAGRIIRDWYERVKEYYVTEDDKLELGIRPELKCFHEQANHRIKFSRKDELDVTYGLRIREKEGRLFIESSVNNKSDGFDFEDFVGRLESYYWRYRFEKPWIEPDFDRFTYADLLDFEPRVGHSVSLDVREEKADIIRLSFALNPRHEELLLLRQDVLKDLLENYCLAPLRRIYAESYREQ